MKFAKPLGRVMMASPLRIYLLMLTLAGLPLSLFLIAAHHLLVQQTTERLKAQSGEASRVVGNLIEKNLDQSKALLESFASRPNLQANIRSKNFFEVTKHLEQAYSLRPDFMFFSIYDVDGTMRAIHPADPAVLNRNFATRDWYQGVMRSSKAYVSEVYRTAVDGHLQVIAVAVPIKNSRGETIAILMAPHTVESLMQDLHSLSTPQSSTSLSLIDQNGHVFGNPNASFTVIDANHAINPALVSQVQSEQDTTQFQQLNGRSVLVAFHRMPSLQWGVLIEVPAEAISQALWQYEKKLGFLGLMLIGLAIFAGGFLASMQKQLKDSEEKSRVIVERARDAFIAMDSHGKVSEWNPQAERIFGWSREEAIDQTLSELIIPLAYRPAHEMGLKRFLSTGEGPVLDKQLELAAIRRSGEEFPVELSISAFRFVGGHYFNAFIRDISDRKRYQQEIEEKTVSWSCEIVRWSAPTSLRASFSPA